jgi:alkylation response protein AidB-like acyl-CoA dehydrogenase
METNPVTVMGVRGTGTAEVKLHGCEVGGEAIVGGLNGGLKVVLDDLNNGRTRVGAIGLGIVQAAIKEAKAYARGDGVRHCHNKLPSSSTLRGINQGADRGCERRCLHRGLLQR